MDLINYDSDSSEGNGSVAKSSSPNRKRTRGDAASEAPVNIQKAPRTTSAVVSAPVAPAFRTLDADAQSASASARRKANALFERKAAAVGGAASYGGGGGGGVGVEVREEEEEEEQQQQPQQWSAQPPAAAAEGASAPLVPLDASRALDAHTLGLLDSRSRRELGLDSAGRFAGFGGGGGGVDKS